MPGSNNVDCLTDQVEIYQHFLLEATTSLRLRIIYLILKKEIKKIKASNKKAEFFNNSLKLRNWPQEFNNSTIVPAQTALIFNGSCWKFLALFIQGRQKRQFANYLPNSNNWFYRKLCGKTFFFNFELWKKDWYQT